MTQPPSAVAPDLGARLRALRTESGATQKDVATALGLGVSSISTYEKGAVPPDARLVDYATFFALKRARTDGQLPPDTDLTDEERATRTELLEELRALLPWTEADAGTDAVVDPWTFPTGEPIMLVVGQLEEMTHPYSDANNPNYTRALALADLDALLELHGHVRMRNPDSDVRFIRSDQLTAADNLTRHLVMLGGPGLNTRLQQIFARTPLPIRQTEHKDVKDGEVFVVRGQGQPALPEFTDDEFTDDRATDDEAGEGKTGDKRLLTEDVGLFARLINPLNTARTLTWCSGIFARGVLGAVRMLTDATLRDRNAAYLARRFATATQFAILARVPVLLGETITPDLQNEDARLYEWSDAEPRQPGEAWLAGDARKRTRS